MNYKDHNLEELVQYVYSKGENAISRDSAMAAVYAKIADIQSQDTQSLHAALVGIVKELKENSNSSDRLGKRVYWLNVVLTCATVGLFVVAWLSLKSSGV